MSIWFYLFWAVLILLIVLIIKIIIIKIEINNIDACLQTIINTDTNALITLNSNDKALKKLAISLNKNLKALRKLGLEYKNGSGELKSSITNISHDLRTPLTAIKGYLELMDSSNLTTKQKSYLKIINSKVNDLTELTEQLFDFSKAIDIQNDIKKDSLCLNNILEDSISSFYVLFKEHNIIPKVIICNEKIVRSLNENMLKRIFENIISNAIKYGEDKISITLTSNGTIIFKNKTTSLDATSLEKIFARYYTVKNARKSNGIGLSIAKQLVELMGGNIKAHYKDNYLTIEISFA